MTSGAPISVQCSKSVQSCKHHDGQWLVLLCRDSGVARCERDFDCTHLLRESLHEEFSQSSQSCKKTNQQQSPSWVSDQTTADRCHLFVFKCLSEIQSSELQRLEHKFIKKVYMQVELTDVSHDQTAAEDQFVYLLAFSGRVTEQWYCIYLCQALST